MSLALSLAVLPTVHAADAAVEPSPAVMAFVRELQARNLPRGFAAVLSEKSAEVFVQHGLRLENARRLVDTVVRPSFERHLPELETALAGIWSSRFSANEIDDLRVFLADRSATSQQEFLATPLGLKLQSQKAAMGAESGQQTRAWALRCLQLSLTEHPAEARAAGLDPVTGEPLPGATTK